MVYPKRPLPPSKKAVLVIFHDYEREYGNKAHGRHADKALDIFLTEEKRHGVRATYNIVGKICESHPNSIHRILQEDHEIASHTYGHIYPCEINNKKFEEDLLSFHAVYSKLTGRIVHGFRSPESRWSKGMIPILERHGYKWNAEADRRFQPYILCNGLLRIPVFFDDWSYMEGSSPEMFLRDVKSVIKRAKQRHAIGGIGFHPWIHGISESRLNMFSIILDMISSDREIQTMSFSDVYQYSKSQRAH